ncbi:endoplasmic reticulum resident protein 29 [Copidosoma floridanum]|uniref:endoplasmic reticulum resident protein 29 n=1 Tax=Copidosoma floridanum TaxID=29053 RepID=UPI0006C9C020|nr:endoplasmic reticulum resident protein 29 [Copidosoma floridanum]
MILRQIFLATLSIFLVLGYDMEFAAAEDCSACVQLTSHTFDKILPKFKAVLVKFDVVYPYGDKHKEYTDVAVSTKDSPDLLIAEVGVKDFGNKDNQDLAKRFGIKPDDYPTLLLFVNGRKEPYRFVAEKDDEFTANNIKRFIKKKTSLYLGLPGCIEKLDQLADEFKANEKDRKEIFNKAKLFEETLPEEHREAAKVYIKLMAKILEKGDVFVQTEQTRLENLLKGKLSVEKKKTMEERRNILQSFMFRDEL